MAFFPNSPSVVPGVKLNNVRIEYFERGTTDGEKRSDRESVQLGSMMKGTADAERGSDRESV